MTEVVEAEIVDEQGGEVVHLPVAATPTTLFRTDDPVQVLERATETANAMKAVLRDQNLTSTISGREHVRVEGWQTLGAMLGVTPVCTWTRQTENGWEARVEARTLDGRVIGAAEAECERTERTWKNRDNYALRSMAQTRATSKALSSVLRFVVTLAGFDGTPAEEMNASQEQGRKPSGKVTKTQRELLRKVCAERKLKGPTIRRLLKEVGGVEKVEDLPKAKVDELKVALEAAPEES